MEHSAVTTESSSAAPEDNWFQFDPDRVVRAAVALRAAPPQLVRRARRVRPTRRASGLGRRDETEMVDFSGPPSFTVPPQQRPALPPPHTVTLLRDAEVFVDQLTTSIAQESEFYSSTPEIHSLASEISSFLRTFVVDLGAALQGEKNLLFKERSEATSRPYSERAVTLQSECAAAMREIDAAYQWKVTAARLLDDATNRLRDRVRKADAQTQSEYEELALLQQQTSALFEKQAQVTMDLATLDAMKARTTQLIAANETIIDSKSALVMEVEAQEKQGPPRAAALDAKMRETRMELKLLRARQSLVQRRRDAQNGINDGLRTELSALSSHNEVLSSRLEEMKTEYAVREAEHLRDYTPRPEPNEEDESTSHTTSARLEYVIKKLNGAAVTARRYSEEYVKLGRFVIPVADIEMGIHMLPPYDGFDQESFSHRGGRDDDDDDDEASRGTIYVQGHGAAAIGVPAFIQNTQSFNGPLWTVHQTEKNVQQFLRVMSQTASGSYLQQLQPKQGFATPMDSLSFRLTECAMKAATVLPMVVPLDLTASAAQQNAATRQSILHLITCCQHHAKSSIVSSVALRVLAGSLPMQVLDAALQIVSKITTQTPTDGPGVANVKAVFASIQRDLVVLGASAIVTARYALLMDAATSGSGSSSTTRLSSLMETSSDSNRRVGLFLRTVVRLYVNTYEGCLAALEGAMRAITIASETHPGMTLVQTSRLRSAWERLKVDANTLTALPHVKLTNEVKPITISVKVLCDQLFAELPTMDAKSHGLASQAQRTADGESTSVGRRSSRRSTTGSAIALGTDPTRAAATEGQIEVATDLADASLIAALLRTTFIRIAVVQ